MSGNEPLATGPQRLSKPMRLIIVLAGIVLGQAVLYGPSLIGQKILLPLDILASRNVYLPHTPDVATFQPHNLILSDLIFLFEPERRFAVSEFHAGRLPMWAPYHFTGAPFVWPKFSPFLALGCVFASPVVLAWVQLLAALVAGLGMYAFCRRVLALSFWPAAFAAWCYPLTGFFILAQGFTLGMPVYWLPWILLAVDRTIRRTSPWGGVGLSLVTGLTLTSGQLDVAGQVLLTSGCFAVWCWLDHYRKEWLQRQARKAVLSLALGWGLGLLLAAPYVLPVLDYAQNGARVALRSGGTEERAPVGVAALPQVVLPWMYGATEHGSLPVFPKNQPNLQESTAQTYTGLLATLLVAPLAFCSRRHRSINLFWVLLAFFALSWSLNVPGFVQILRLPGLNLMSHNRLVFAASFAILALAAVGLDLLWQGRMELRRWLWLFPGVLLGLGAWSAYRAIMLPEPVRTELALGLAQGKNSLYFHDLAGVSQIQAWFCRSHTFAAVLCGLGVAGWLFLWRRQAWQLWLGRLSGFLLVGDLIWFGFGRYSQCDPALYYPRIPVLEQLAKSPPGRIIGFGCLPPLLATTHGLRDIRGYDPIVPARILDLTRIGSDPRSPTVDYALMQYLIPLANPTSEGDIRLSPVMDMLNVRYVIFRGAPIATDRPLLQGGDYWVVENRSALPRAYVPLRALTVAEEKAQLQKLAEPDFDPRLAAYVEVPVDLPAFCRGTAEIVAEIPTRITAALRMETPGLVVLSDLWDHGWRAYLNGQRVPMLRVNHAIRGVIAPAGSGTLEFRYEPASFAWGLKLAALAGLAMLGWASIIVWKRRPALVPAAQNSR